MTSSVSPSGSDTPAPGPQLSDGWVIWAGRALPNFQPHVLGALQTDFAVYVKGNHIRDAGPRAAMVERYPDAHLFGGDDLLLMPGMINSHDHGRGLGTLVLGVPDDLLEVWLTGLSVLPAIDAYKLALVEGVALLRSGVTATAHSHNPADWLTMAPEADETLRGYGETGIRVAFHPPYVDQNGLIYNDRNAFLAGLPAPVRAVAEGYMRGPALSRDDYFALCDDLFARYHDPVDHRIQIQISPAGGQWCSDALILAARDWAIAHNSRLQMHLLETGYQARYARQRWGKSFVSHLADIGALGPWLTLAHMVWSEVADIPLLAEHGVAIVHNPSSNLRLRSGIAPLPDFHAAGLTLGIGLDGSALDDDQDYLRELRLAWTLANRPGARSPTIPAAAVLHMGTAGGAAATFGPSAPLGHLQPGALADLVLINWRGVEGIWSSPLTPPVDLLLRRGSSAHVRHVMVNGTWAIRDGRSTSVDEEALHAEVRAYLQRTVPAAAQPSSNAAQLLAPYIRQFYAGWELPQPDAQHALLQKPL